MTARVSLDVFVRRAAALGATAALAGALHAQTVPDQVRAQVASARLGAGYAQMINLSATPDLSAASYRIDGIDPSADLDVLRLPYQAKWFPLSDAADLYLERRGGLVAVQAGLPLESHAGRGRDLRQQVDGLQRGRRGSREGQARERLLHRARGRRGARAAPEPHELRRVRHDAAACSGWVAVQLERRRLAGDARGRARMDRRGGRGQGPGARPRRALVDRELRRDRPGAALPRGDQHLLGPGRVRAPDRSGRLSSAG